MPFVKLDCGIVRSTLWFDREAREIFITGLLMAYPFELTEPTPQLRVDSLEEAGWIVPAGWYGMIDAAGCGIVRIAGLEEKEGMDALRRLGEPEAGSRSPEYDGRRMVRVSGGYIVLNFIKYRDRDYTTSERSRRYRERKRHAVTTLHHAVTDHASSRGVTHTEYILHTEQNPPTPQGDCSKPEPDPIMDIPASLQTPAFVSKWREWMTIRRGMKRVKNWVSLFNEQLQWLAQFHPVTAVEILSSSIRNGWQGLFEPKEQHANTNSRTNTHHIDRNAGTFNEGRAGDYENAAALTIARSNRREAERLAKENIVP